MFLFWGLGPVGAPHCRPHALDLCWATSGGHQDCIQGRDRAPGGSLQRSSDAKLPASHRMAGASEATFRSLCLTPGAPRGDQASQQARPRCPLPSGGVRWPRRLGGCEGVHRESREGGDPCLELIILSLSREKGGDHTFFSQNGEQSEER